MTTPPKDPASSILNQLVAGRTAHLPELRAKYGHLRVSDLPRATRSLELALKTRSSEGQARPLGPALIMECKAASPSKGTIRSNYNPTALAREYAPVAAAISVLTEPDRFGGDFAHLAAVRATVSQPVLCKDFIIDPVQVFAARANGADAILLMLSVLDDPTYLLLSGLAGTMGMEVLTEVDSAEQMQRAAYLGARIIGINNRDLRTLEIDLGRTETIAPLAPKGVVIVGESGVSTRDDVLRLAPYVDALLVGSHLSGSNDVKAAAYDLAGGQPSGSAAAYAAQAQYMDWKPLTSAQLAAREDHHEGETIGARAKLPTYFGEFGGQFVPELLIPALDQLEAAFVEAVDDPSFLAEVNELLHRYLGRPTPVTELRNLPLAGNARILLKREDLVHGGAHKGNQVLGQALLAKRMGKTRVIAETGAGQHGTATAMICALLGLECTIYMGATDVIRQAANVERMELMGATVIPVTAGSGTLKDAVNEALRDWTASFDHSHYLLGTAAGPHPFPTMVREFHRIISSEARAQVLAHLGHLPDAVVACVGGGSNAIGTFAEFIDDPTVALYGVEPAGKGLDTLQHGAPINMGKTGVLHGACSYLMRTDDGQIEESYSISAGLDYPGVGPEHAWLAKSGRATYVGATDDEAIEAFRLLSRHEGIIPAVESSHALAHALKLAKEADPFGEPTTILVCLSGRGDKDLEHVREYLGGSFSEDGAVARAAALVGKVNHGGHAAISYVTNAQADTNASN